MLDQADVPTAHGSDVAEHSTVSGAVSDAVTNGIAAGAALVSTGLHAVAEIAKTGIRGQEEVEPVKDGEGEGAEKGKEADGEEPKEAKREGLRLQFGSFDESLAENILADAPTGVMAVENGVCSGSVTPREASSAASSRAGSVANLSPVPSQSIDAKPFVPGAAEPGPSDAGAPVKGSSGTLNVNAPEFTPGAAVIQNGAVAAAGGQNGAAADVMWSDVGITDETDSSQDWNQWGYSDQAVWSDEYQEYGTWALGNDGQYMWYPSQVASNWDAGYGNGQYWNGSGGYYINGNGRTNGGYAANGQAVVADAKIGQPGAGKKARKDKRKDGKQQSLKDIHGAEAVRSASLAVLEQQFPAYSSASLAEMLAASKDDLSRALDILARLEAEQATAPTGGTKGEVLILDEENFPSLSAASSPAKPLSKRAAAAAATVRPASPDTPLHSRAEDATPETSRSASPAPPAAAKAASDALEAAAPQPEAVPTETLTAEAKAVDAAAPAAEDESASATAGSGDVTPDVEKTSVEPAALDAALEQAQDNGEAAAASDKDNAAEQVDATPAQADAAPVQAALFAPPVAAWGRKEKPAFLMANSAEEVAAAAPAPPADAPKRAVPITQGSMAARKAGRKGAAGGAGGNAPWVATGAAADAQYSEARVVARDHMRLRNQLFQQATQAFLGGDKALAKELGAKGRWHASQMATAHSDASDAIFRQRNPTKGANGQVAVIDLHGQHVAEALKLLRRELTRLRSSAGGQNRQPAKSGNRRVQILVGTNHHSKGKHTPLRLPVAVEEFLKNEGITFKKPLPGALEINA